MRVSKLHGTGNDFLVTVALDGSEPPDAAVARALCDRHRGIGADGLIALLPGGDGSDCTMQLRNAGWWPRRDERQRDPLSRVGGRREKDSAMRGV